MDTSSRSSLISSKRVLVVVHLKGSVSAQRQCLKIPHQLHTLGLLSTKMFFESQKKKTPKTPKSTGSFGREIQNFRSVGREASFHNGIILKVRYCFQTRKHLFCL
ncbi:hypothetical protein Y032_0154g2988 [Ancylostoma ceylanicum]|uniref:Uncharacterized protein n=1 Tax=Ancylostoma ceylanicum TaxID=53326 RepID=A0A016SZY3_9BILA|nr:hypothetical protein Y032_0154g2988 [Ancylostoma ceylanicum]